MSPLRYYLVDNAITKDDPNDCRAIPMSVEVLNEKEIVKLIKFRGSALTEQDISSTLTLLYDIVAEAVKTGKTLKLPLISTNFSITGKFDSASDVFDSRHRVKLNITKGPVLRKAEEDVKLEKVSPPKQLSPLILEVRDISGDLNSTLTSGGTIQIKGYNIRIAGDDPTCGVWFVSEDGSETKAAIPFENMPSRIICQTPQLAPGVYRAKVTTQFTTGGILLKEPRSFIFERELTVQ